MNACARELTKEELMEREHRKMMQAVGGRVAPQKDCISRPQERREINRLVEDLNAVAERYENLVARLSDMTSAVTSIAPPESLPNTEAGCLSTSLGNNLESIRIRLRDSANDLESILERIEL